MVGVVGVDRLTRNDPLAVHDLVVGYVVDIRMAGDVVFLLVVLLQFAKHLGCRLELLGREILVADYKNVVGHERAVECGVRVLVNWFAQVNAACLGADVFGQGRDRAGHVEVPPSRVVFLPGCRLLDGNARHAGCRGQADEWSVWWCYGRFLQPWRSWGIALVVVGVARYRPADRWPAAALK